MRRLPGQAGDGELTLANDLRAAKALISDPKNWCKGHYHDRGRFCAFGACRAAVRAAHPDLTAEDTAYRAFRVGQRLQEVTGKWPTNWNDEKTTTHADVMAAFDRAIEKAEAQG